MRQVMLWVPRQQGDEVRARAAEAGATHTLRVEGESEQGPAELLVVHMPNERLSPVLDAIGSVDDVRVAFQRDSVTLLEPPQEDLPDQVTDVSMRGPLEILVEGLQSVGSWSSFLVYSAIAGSIVWAGLSSNTVFLLTAATLIAPYAAPAMTAALATARGDAQLLSRSVGRYAASIGLTAGAAAALTLLTGMTEATNLMVEVADVSAVSVILPVLAGVAGAMNFGQADRTGTVSGAGVGMLVALALAPQAGLLGIASVIGEARIAASAAFVAALQLVGINVVASTVLYLMGVRRRTVRARAGSTLVGAISLAATAVAALALVVVQWSVHPELSRETMVARAEAITTAVLDEHPTVHPVEASARFPLADGQAPRELVAVEGRVVATGDGVPDEAVLAGLVRARLAEELAGVDPQVAVTVAGP